MVKDRRKRVFALIMAVVTLAATSTCAAYDRTAAVDYALRYWDVVCSDGYYFVENTGPTQLGPGAVLPTEHEGYDCAHFVSCCVGNEPNDAGGGLDVPSRTLAYGEPGAQRLTDWLLDNGATRVKRVSSLLPGDVIAYDADHNGWIEHVTLYMGNGLVTSHSISRYSEWNPDPDSDFLFLHLPGTDDPPRLEGEGWMSWLVLAAALTGIALAIVLTIPR
ncbi:amidase domain-containing protein [Candidatus Bipolaricaulota bacterium]|nr:amidase domain-containing protein [Candidatus Bipolaricaulota bacterium]TFH06892.1 MAG: hypothetical protein E4H08_10365 [Candidatus Atribacteria bacterium]